MLATSHRRALAMLALLTLATSSCAKDEPDVLSHETLHGKWKGADWAAGPGAVHRDPQSIIVVRIFEQGTQGDPCSLPITTGRRIEITLPYLAEGSYDAKLIQGFRVEAWDGLTGQSDPSSLAEIDQASKKTGDKVMGRARFGSMITGEIIEGSFTATVCEDLP
jgi:hypothetical protein